MKIRTDFVTNSSSSSFTVAICFKMKDGKEITHSAEWSDEETDLVVNKDPLKFAKAKDMDELIQMLNDSIFIGVEDYGNEDYFEENDEYEEVEIDDEDINEEFTKFGEALKNELNKYKTNDIESITLKAFETDDYDSTFEYSEIPPKYYDEEDLDGDDYHQTHYEIYKYNLKTNTANYFDDDGFVETNGGVGGKTQLNLDDSYIEEDDYKDIDNDTKTRKKEPKKVFILEDNVLVEYKGKEKTVVVPDGIEVIGCTAFEGCTTIEEIILPEGLKEIEEEAFIDCTNLSKINIPSSVERIGAAAFEGCNGLADENSLIIINNILFGSINFASRDVFEIPNNVKEIGPEAFQTLKFCFKEVIIPDSVRIIGEKAFYGCMGLENVIIPDTVEEIRDKAFKVCRIKEIHLPEHLYKYKETAFDKGVVFI